jgi:hypothetical protein
VSSELLLKRQEKKLTVERTFKVKVLKTREISFNGASVKCVFQYHRFEKRKEIPSKVAELSFTVLHVKATNCSSIVKTIALSGYSVECESRGIVVATATSYNSDHTSCHIQFINAH